MIPHLKTKFAAQLKWLVLLCVITWQGTVWADGYSDGLKAYLNSDFEAAKTHWLSSAKENDARSMFNLGLLHQQNKIANANLQKAHNWFQLAGQHGYVAGYYHRAVLLIESDAQSRQAYELMQMAADKGYFPARRFLGQNKAPVATAKSLKARESRVTSSAESKGSEFKTEGWISALRASNWTIQMLAFKDQSKVEQFIADNQIAGKAAYFSEKDAQQVTWYKLIYGSFESKQAADQARNNLPVGLKTHGPWLRTIGSVQQIINASN